MDQVPVRTLRRHVCHDHCSVTLFQLSVVGIIYRCCIYNDKKIKNSKR